jgi:hypothetical protein
MSWRLRKKPDHSKANLPKLPKLPRLPKLPKLPKLPRPPKPRAPLGHEYYWKDD